MILVPALLSLLLGTLFVGLLAKLVIRLARRYTLSWRAAFAYGALVTAAGVAGLLLRFFSGVVVPGLLGAAIAVLFHGLMGGWFLGTRVKDGDGQAIGLWRGALLGLLVFGAVLAIGFVVGALQGLLEVQRGTEPPL